MTGPDTNDQDTTGGAGQSTGGDSQNAGAGAPDSAADRDAGSSSGSSDRAASSSSTTEQTTTTRTQRRDVAQGVKRADGSRGQDSASKDVHIADGGARERDEQARRNR